MLSSTVFIIKILYAVLFMFAGVMHLAKPKLFKHFIPNFLPKLWVNYGIGIIEFVLGLGLVFSRFEKEAALGIFFLLILFLPIHIWDAFKKKPAIGSHYIAWMRIPLQFVLMYYIYEVYKNAMIIIM